MYRTGTNQVRDGKAGISGMLLQKTSLVPRPGPRFHRDWRALKLMVATLLAGVVFALTQHLMNTYLNGRELGSVHLSQGWITRVETALAFLVKTCLVVATGEAFIQYQWLHLRREPFRVKDLDTMTGVLGNILKFSDISIWFHRPLLTAIAIITWTIPLAAIVTPGSLSVEQKPKSNVTYLQVPQHDWAEGEYGYTTCCAGGDVITNATTQRIAYATGVNARLLSLPSMFQNQSYHLAFYGPAIKCGEAEQNVTDMIERMFFSSASGTTTDFVSWVPAATGSHNLPYENISNKTDVNILGSVYSSIDQTSVDGSRIFVMMRQHYSSPKRVIVSKCMLYNATYDVDFTFSYPDQGQQIVVSRYFDPVAGKTLHGAGQNERPLSEMYRVITSYSAVMDAFGKLLVGYSSSNQYGYAVKYYTSYALLSIDWTDSDATQRGLEALFHNITLSLLSHSSLTKNSSRAEFVPVTVTSWPVTYVYSPWELWTAYGLSCAFALACILVGTYAFVSNEGSYQNTFSTFARAISDKDEFHDQVRVADQGTDPLPQELANIRLHLRKGS